MKPSNWIVWYFFFKKCYLNSYYFVCSIINATASTKSTLKRLDSWNSGLDCCHWIRVICSSHFGSKTVLALYLSDITWYSLWLPSTILTLLFHMIRSMMDSPWLACLSINLIRGELSHDGFGNLTKLVHIWRDKKNKSVLNAEMRGEVEFTKAITSVSGRLAAKTEVKNIVQWRMLCC